MSVLKDTFAGSQCKFRLLRCFAHNPQQLKLADKENHICKPAKQQEITVKTTTSTATRDTADVISAWINAKRVVERCTSCTFDTAKSCARSRSQTGSTSFELRELFERTPTKTVRTLLINLAFWKSIVEKIKCNHSLLFLFVALHHCTCILSEPSSWRRRTGNYIPVQNIYSTLDLIGSPGV